MDPPMHTTLISVHELTTQRTPEWLVVDCRFDLANPSAGERAYAEGHIPGAIYAHLDRDLSSPITPQSGRHPLPSPQGFAATLSSWGLSRQPPAKTQVVAYDADNGMYASRLWWLLRWAGHDAVAVLDGGFKAWTASGGAASTDVPRRQPSEFHFTPRADLAVTSAEVADLVKRADWRVLDARAPERFSGKVEPIDRVGGHVPGARNHPFAGNLGADAKFLSAAELRARFGKSQDGVADERTIAMCGSGVTACHLLLALEHAGKRGARLYTGSWSEWIRDPQRPIAKD
jgi:thiosulfate/3-mercaptopyruvate sulfurtransferase